MCAHLGCNSSPALSGPARPPRKSPRYLIRPSDKKLSSQPQQFLFGGLHRLEARYSGPCKALRPHLIKKKAHPLLHQSITNKHHHLVFLPAKNDCASKSITLQYNLCLRFLRFGPFWQRAASSSTSQGIPAVEGSPTDSTHATFSLPQLAEFYGCPSSCASSKCCLHFV